MTSKRFFATIFIFISIVLGIWLGNTLEPERFQISGDLVFDPSDLPSTDYTIGNFLIKWRSQEGGLFTIEALDRPGVALFETIPGKAFLAAALGDEKVTESRGIFKFNDNLLYLCNRQRIDSIQLYSFEFTVLEISGKLICGSRSIDYLAYFGQQESTPQRQLEFLLITDPDFEETNRIFFTYASNRSEQFFGFGEQFSHFNFKGHRFPIWVSEQGVGRGAQPITLGANLTAGGAGGNSYSSYAPIPFYITSQMRSVLLSNPYYTEIDLRNPDRVQIRSFTGVLQGVIIDGHNPPELIQEITRHTGRMRQLPDWIISGAIVGMQGGTERVRQVLNQLQAFDSKIAGFWLQDWVGQRTTSFGKQLWWNWEVDRDHYPDWDTLVEEMGQQGIRILLYTSPYLVDAAEKENSRRNLFKEALENDFLVKDSNGDPYLVLNTDFKYGMVDLTNPVAYAWMRHVIRTQLIGSGASGWMADFGESLPYDASLYSSSPAERMHNLYPVIWARLNREIADEAGSDIVFFTRSGFTQSPAYTTLFWEGDQLVSWDEHDGIKSAVTGLNSSGLSGFAFNHSDIGGYTTITNPIRNYHRSKELLLRWMEMNAFTTVFRTHEGNQPENNVQFYSDDETLAAFAYWSRIYALLFDYRKALVLDAAETGLPVVRHPFIHFPEDPETWKISYQQFMLGQDFIIAPVLDPGKTEVKAYLPAGEWVHVWSETPYGNMSEGTYVTVPAPLGQPCVFIKKGSLWGEAFIADLKSSGLMLRK